MAKKYLVFTLMTLLMLPLSSCTSGSNKEGGETPLQQNDAAFSQEGGDLAAQGSDNPQNQLQLDGQPVAQDGAKPADLNAPQDAGQDLALDGQQQPGGGVKDELSLDDPQPLPDGLAGDPGAAPPADPGAAPPPEGGDAQASAAPPSDEPLFKGEAGKPEEASPGPTDVASATPDAAPAPKAFAPLQKIKDGAFDKDGTNLNRVYIARADDKSVAAISKKIYGNGDRAKDLKAWNPSIAKRKPKVGDKIYYQSAASPDDKTMLTYYDEAGIQSKVYVTQEGDNLRKLAKNWLGSKDSWKEVWSTNPNVDSKGDVPAGLEIKYWGNEGGSVAKAEPPPPADAPAPPPAETAPPPPPTDMAQNDIPPPPPPPPPAPPTPASAMDPPVGAPGTVEPPPPPPPPGDQAAPPPPPPLESKGPKKSPVAKGGDLTEEDPDTTVAMGIGAILLIAAAVLFVVLRRNRAKRVDLGQTQV